MKNKIDMDVDKVREIYGAMWDALSPGNSIENRDQLTGLMCELMFIVAQSENEKKAYSPPKHGMSTLAHAKMGKMNPQSSAKYEQFRKLDHLNSYSDVRESRELYISTIKRMIVERYADANLGEDFGPILRHEMSNMGQSYLLLAEKWKISVSLLGELIHDHCKRLK